MRKGNALDENLEKVYRLVDLRGLITGMIGELRTPLSSIISYAELIRSTSQEETVKKYAAYLHLEGLRASEILNNMIAATISRKTASLQIVDLNAVVRQTVSLFAYQMKARGVRLETDFAVGALPVRGDFFHLQRAVYIAVLNVLHLILGSHGGARLSVSTEDRSGRVRIVIRSDSSPGPSAGGTDTLKQFFSMMQKGTGLGWYTISQILAAHGGTVSASGDSGCTLMIELPSGAEAQTEDAPGPAAGGEPRPGRMRVLVVDDEVITGAVAKELLESLGCDVAVETEPATAIERLKIEEFDLLMVDYLMPHMNGIEFIRQSVPFLSQCRTVLMSGDHSIEGAVPDLGHPVRVLKKPFGLKELEWLTGKNPE